VTLPLSGIKVFDLSSVIMAPFATQLLGDLGADVVSVETPTLSTNRMMTAGPHAGLSGVSLNLLRNKRSIIVDLAIERGREVALGLAATCDVFVTNLRPGSLRRLGFDYPAVAAKRSDVVYCQAQGFPMDGPAADEPAYDDIIQAATGLAELGARIHGRPALVPTVIADKVCGLTIAQAVLAGLVRRERTGEGAHIEVPMVDVMTSFILVEHAGAAAARPPQGPAGYERILTPRRRPAATKDGWIHVLPYTRRNFADLFNAAGRADLADDRIVSVRSRVNHADSLYGDVEEILGTQTTAEWLAFCRDRQIPATEVASLEQMIDELPSAQHPQAGTYKATRTLARFDGNADAPIRRHAPLQGEQTREILAEIGLNAAAVDDLIADGVVREEPQHR
jgi:crotonobetainyl-CoA:carnitine CoA-transferase CaiB-like acyl-CoA transferase